MIDFLNEIALTPDKLHEEVEFLIDGFVPKGLITIYYADGGNAKTWTSYAVAATLRKYELSKMVYYLDFDNPLPIVTERGVAELLMNRFTNFKYIHRSDLKSTPLELLEKLATPERCRGNAYKGMTMIIDSLRDMIPDIKNDSKAMYMMNLIKTIRDAGMTFVAILHSNKDTKNYEGSNNIKNSCDVMFKQKLLKSVMGQYVVVELTAKKERAGIKDCVYKIDTNTLDMEKADPISSRMSEVEENFIKKIQQELKKNPEGLKQGKLLMNAVGKTSTDKPTVERLNKFIGEYYTCEGTGNSKIFKSL